MAINDPRQTEQSAQIWQKQDGRNIYEIMKTICPPNYHHNGFVATHALGHKAIVVIPGRAHYLHDCIYITPIYIYIYIYILGYFKESFSGKYRIYHSLHYSPVITSRKFQLK